MIVKNIDKIIDSKYIFKNVSFILNDEEKVALIGKNGVGKSTLLRSLFENDIDSGKIILNEQKIAFLKQEISISDYEYTVFDYIKKELGLFCLSKKIIALEECLDESNMNEYGELLEKFLALDGYNIENNALKILHGLKYGKTLDCKIGNLSGGDKMKISLTCVLLANADILFLDEPTNNLDFDAIVWLETFLKNTSKKILIVSHDADLLNNIATKIFELKDQELFEYNMSYFDFLIYKENEYNNMLNDHYKNIKLKKDLRNSIQKTKEWAQKGNSKIKTDNDKIANNYQKEQTKKTFSKIKILNNQLNSIVDDDFKEREEIDFKINADNSKGNHNIFVSDLVCGYDNFQGAKISIDIEYGDRVIILGKNGSGKTTFINAVMKKENILSGNINVGSDIKFGYISQNSLDLSSSNQTIYDYLIGNVSNSDKGIIFTVLDKFNISYSDKDKLYGKLSPGERTKVNLAKLAIDKVNTIIFDEVTNHLDLDAINIINKFLNNFDGTVISVSHNRNFNRNLVANKILDIETGKIYSDFEDYMNFYKRIKGK